MRNLEQYDSVPVPKEAPDKALDGISRYYAEYPSTHSRDKAELVAFGVNGEVPLAQARVNAGLDTVNEMRHSGGFLPLTANDNTKSAAIAA